MIDMSAGSNAIVAVTFCILYCYQKYMMLFAFLSFVDIEIR